MTIRTTFLQLQSPTQLTNLLTLNCSSWTENEYAWLGGAERTANNTLLQTLNTPKREWAATVEFPDFSGVETLIRFTAVGIDPGTNKPTGLRTLNLVATGAYGALRRTGAAVPVLVRINRYVPWVSMVPGVAPNLNIETETQGWTVDLTLQEI